MIAFVKVGYRLQRTIPSLNQLYPAEFYFLSHSPMQGSLGAEGISASWNHSRTRAPYGSETLQALESTWTSVFSLQAREVKTNPVSRGRIWGPGLNMHTSFSPHSVSQNIITWPHGLQKRLEMQPHAREEGSLGSSTTCVTVALKCNLRRRRKKKNNRLKDGAQTPQHGSQWSI